MAITVNSVAPSFATENQNEPSALFATVRVNVDLDTSYPTGGYDLSANLPGVTVRACAYVPHYDGAALRWFRVEDSSGTPKLVGYVNTSGAPGAQVAGTTDLHGHTGLELDVFYG